MAITVNEQGQKNLQDGDINELRATRFFLVKSDAVIDAVAASNASGIPTYFAAHPEDSTYLMKQKRTRSLGEEAGRFCWEVQCDYSNQIVSPLSMPAQIEWDFSEATENYFIDTAGKPVVTSAGETFEAIPTREAGAIICNITKNVVSSFDCSLFLLYRDTLNNESFTVDGVTLTTHQSKVSGASVSAVQKQNAVTFRTVKLQLKFKTTWDDKFADMGLNELVNPAVPTDGMVPILAGNPLMPVTKPYPLDGAGSAAASPLATPATLTFKPYAEADYASLSALLS